MTPSDRDGLIARIRQIRRLAAVRDEPSPEPEASARARVRALEERVEHLEQMVEGLQDSVHRESERHDKMLAEIHEQIQPGAMGASLADDARHRGL